MSKNPLLKIQDFGQSIWLDFIRRHMLISGELTALIEEDGLRGVTSNPAIFEKAISGSNDYLAAIGSLAQEGKNSDKIYETLAIEDVQQTADAFRPVFDKSGGQYGFVSLEVSPRLARDTPGTIKEAHYWWDALDRPNVFIKVPATKEGLPAIKQLISEGINVNVTLLFGLERYRAVTGAYIAGLEQRAAAGNPVERVASVASFFLSRIDLLVDPLLEKAMKQGGERAKIADSLRGETAIASAKIAYQIYKEVFSTERFQKLADKGACPQPVLWASTSTKNPAYSDVKYVEALIGPNTINTLPLETLTAYRDHGNPASRLEQAVDKARKVLDVLPQVGVDLMEVTQQLEDEGIDKFVKPFDRLMKALEEKRKEALSEPVDAQVLHLGQYKENVENRMSNLESVGFVQRLWRKDPSLWEQDLEVQKTICSAMGWLHVAEKMVHHVPQLQKFATQISETGFQHVVHMGMGGSSLAPLVFQESLPAGKHGLKLTVLDTTDPATLLKVEREIPLKDTLFIVATKSGTTAEPLAFGDYFYDKVKALKSGRAGENFVAITDPGSPLVDIAMQRNFRHVFLNYGDIGGRYSALSYFGLLPAVLKGIDIGELLERALRMAHACASAVPVPENPGLVLGTSIGELASRGLDKLTFFASEGLTTLGLWLEQLLAESTGKEGKGVLPVANEPIGEPSTYGDDRVFVYLKLEDKKEESLEEMVRKLATAGRPVITISLKDLLDLGQEFLRWEIATATIGSILGINPFDQPNVQESKDNTNRLLKEVEKEGKLPQAKPALVDGPLQLFANENASDVKNLFSKLFSGVQPGNYISLQAYLTEDPNVNSALQDLRILLRDRLRVATTLGYGPRFLHSTGQYHKGGPNTGLFLQLTSEDPEDAPVPGRQYTFGLLKKAQALGDLEALRKHNRRALRIDLGKDVLEGLAALKRAVESSI
ncbi:MAG: bifunctional transaldolase/phosoglucose isomerase [Desulfomonilaceae bacterium]